jgi:hypothetical protein
MVKKHERQAKKEMNEERRGKRLTKFIEEMYVYLLKCCNFEFLFLFSWFLRFFFVVEPSYAGLAIQLLQ